MLLGIVGRALCRVVGLRAFEERPHRCVSARGPSGSSCGSKRDLRPPGFAVQAGLRRSTRIYRDVPCSPHTLIPAAAGSSWVFFHSPYLD